MSNDSLYLTLRPGMPITLHPDHEYRYEGHIIDVDLTTMKGTASVRRATDGGDNKPSDEYVRPFSFYELETIDGRFNLNRLQSVYGYHEEMTRVVEVGTSQQMNGYPEARMLYEMLNHIGGVANRECDLRAGIYRQQILTAADALHQMGCTADLLPLASGLRGIVAHKSLGDSEFSREMAKIAGVQQRLCDAGFDRLRAGMTPDLVAEIFQGYEG